MTDAQIRSGQIEEKDLDEVAAILARGLGYPKQYFVQVFARLREHDTPPGFPKFGYLLRAGTSIVGIIVLIFSEIKTSSHSGIRCHVTSWYVEPEFRPYATLFFQGALKRCDVSYLNVSARPATVPIINAQGFSKYSEGQFATIPLLHVNSGHGTLCWPEERIANAAYDRAEEEIVLAHVRYGNIGFWCVEKGMAFPFVFQKRLFKGILPGAQLAFCRDVKDVVRFIRPIGLALLRRGALVLRMDANGPLQGLLGIYLPGMEIRYYKGAKPRLGDLAYTQTVMVPFLRKLR